uniref:Kinesin-like protein KIF28P-like n=1 Tax=Saccoglossus kowalevskii TaxID=10224 RepID=A0ABM0GLG5_SACKO|nr:PREDICTED: kinesin-like protein KIF28P-like [Saccoglossus kowalevskii]
MSADSVKVAVRVRPFNQREKNANSKCVISMSGNATTITNPDNGKTHTFAFDYSYWSHDCFKEENGVFVSTDTKYADQNIVFNSLGKGVLDNAWQGYNAALFAYGQTGSGKSYSMIGYGPNRGIVPITCDELFKVIDQNTDKNKQLQVSYSMLEIYNEQVRDLLTKPSHGQRGGLKIRQHPQSGFFVEGLKSVPVRCYKEIERLMDDGTVNRTTASTNMNATSSRSHMVITIKFKQVFLNEFGESTTKSSEISLVDLAGSERADSTGATGDRLKEGSAINQSLSTLGNVISALADKAMGKKKVLVPYRDSVLTKLLQGALGGNSRTIMIAALSPAGINYEETLSTLRYADRAKKIQNKAKINESPTDRLIRELKEENAKLQAMLSKSGGLGSRDGADLEMLLKENERKMSEINTAWEQRLEEARKEWEKIHPVSVSESDNLTKQYPFLQNVNEDLQLCGVIKYPLPEGQTVIGRAGNTPQGNKIQLKGLGIQGSHVLVCNTGTSVTLEPIDVAKTIVNGLHVVQQIELRHLDRIKLGSNSIFLYIGFPHERKNKDDINKYDYEFFQSELAEAEGFGNEQFFQKEDKDAGPDPAALRIYDDFIKILPMTAEVNAISEELGKKLVFEPYIKNLASHDALGRDKAKEVEVRIVDKENNHVWVWSKPKFINRKFIIEELYQNYVENEIDISEIDEEHDPFWDPLEPVFLGSAHIWLQSLAYLMGVDDQIEIHNYKGEEEGIVQCSLKPCDNKKNLLGDDAMVLDPTDLLNTRLDFMMCLSHCLGVKWVKNENTRGTFCKFEFYNCEEEFETKTVWTTRNPDYAFRKQFTIQPVDMEFLTYLQTHALVVQLWGTQGGTVSNRKLSTVSLTENMLRDRSGSWMAHDNQGLELLLSKEKEISALKKKLRQQEDDGLILKDAYDSARKEVFSLKQKLEILRTAKGAKSALKNKSSAVNGSNGHVTVNVMNGHVTPTPQSIDRPASAASIDAEIARALKVFFKDIKGVQQELKELRTDSEKISDDPADMLKRSLLQQHQTVCNIEDDLSACVSSLKTNVTTAIRNMKKQSAMI